MNDFQLQRYVKEHQQHIREQACESRKARQVMCRQASPRRTWRITQLISIFTRTV